jgi:5-methylcytosine-specific restriction endonuclease McrA
MVPGNRARKRRSLRASVFGRDSGVCALCGLDTEDLVRQLQNLWGNETGQDSLLERNGYSSWDWPPSVGRSLWEADHIVPFVDGGSDTLDNLRTLCRPCHAKQTLALLARPRKRE